MHRVLMDCKTFLMEQLTPSSLEDKKDLQQPTLRITAPSKVAALLIHY